MGRLRLPTKGELAALAVADWCKQDGLPVPVLEYAFAKPRRWRFDCAWVAERVSLELHGSTWVGGRHTRGAGFATDRAKMNEAQLLGWIIIEATYIQFHSGEVFAWLRRAFEFRGVV